MPREMRVIERVPIAQVGTWSASTGEWDATRAQFAAAVAASRDPSVRTPRTWIAHDPERIATGQETSAAVGWASNLAVSDDGDTLYADLHVPPLLAETMHAHFPGRSIEARRGVTAQSGQTYDLVIDGIALLGRELPAVETLEDIAELWGMTPAREAPADTPAIAASALIVCALTSAAPAMAGPDNQRQEAPVPSPAPAEPTPAPAPNAQAPAPEPTTPTPTPEATPAPEALTPPEPTPATPEAPQIPDGFRLVEQGVWDDLQARLSQVDDLVTERTAREADEYVTGLVAAGRIAAASRDSIAAQYREDPVRTRAICDLLPEGTHEAPPTGRIAAQRGEDEIDLTDPNVPLPDYLQLRPAKKETR